MLFSNRRLVGRKRDGFVLVMALVLLALASCAMARLANRSLEDVRRGATAERALQARWSLVSCRLALLDRGEELLGVAETSYRKFGHGWPYPAEVALEFPLGGKQVHVLLSDEEARLNLNRLHADRPERLPALLAEVAVYGAIPIQLRPHLSTGRSRSPAFTSWGQVVDLTRLDHGSTSSDRALFHQLQPITERFTCWGSGKLNICRASDKSLRTLLDGVLLPQEVEELLELRQGYRGEWEELLKTLDIPRRRLLRVKQLLSEESSTYCLWMTESSEMAHTSHLLVHDPTKRHTPETMVFPW